MVLELSREVTLPMTEVEKIKEKLPSGEVLEKIVIRSFPKVTVLTYVLAVISLIFGAIEAVIPNTSVWKALGIFFVGLFFFLILVSAFEFTEAKTLLLFSFIVIVVLIYLLLGQMGYTPETDPLKEIYAVLNIVITPHAYIAIGVLLLIAFLLILLSRYFDYWIIEPNQITHKTGLFGKAERYPTQGLQYSVNITDIFEYLLFFGSGTLKLYIPSERRVIVLPLVPKIKKVEKELTKLLGYVEVE